MNYVLEVRKFDKTLVHAQCPTDRKHLTSQNRVLGLAPKPMISLLMGERRQFENWGRPLGGTDFRLYAAGGKAPMTLNYSLHAQPITHFT